MRDAKSQKTEIIILKLGQARANPTTRCMKQPLQQALIPPSHIWILRCFLVQAELPLTRHVLTRVLVHLRPWMLARLIISANSRGRRGWARFVDINGTILSPLIEIFPNQVFFDTAAYEQQIAERAKAQAEGKGEKRKRPTKSDLVHSSLVTLPAIYTESIAGSLQSTKESKKVGKNRMVKGVANVSCTNFALVYYLEGPVVNSNHGAVDENRLRFCCIETPCLSQVLKLRVPSVSILFNATRQTSHSDEARVHAFAAVMFSSHFHAPVDFAQMATIKMAMGCSVRSLGCFLLSPEIHSVW